MQPSQPNLENRQNSSARRWLGVLFEALLIVLIGIGIIFRFNWVNWSQGANLHPDEYGLTSTLTQLSLPKSLGDYFNTRISPLSPYNKYDLNGLKLRDGPDNRMRWGQWPITILRGGGPDHRQHRLQRNPPDGAQPVGIGRLSFAAADLPDWTAPVQLQDWPAGGGAEQPGGDADPTVAFHDRG